MATTLTETQLTVGAKLARWASLVNLDNGDAFLAPDFPDKSVVVRGTFSGATVTLVGANVEGTPPAAAWQTLNDPQGNALTFTSARIEQLLENPYQIRPQVTGGDGTTALLVEILAGTGRQRARLWSK